jgi:PTS system galactitol-specific IIA component
MNEIQISLENILVNEIVDNNEEIIRRLGQLLHNNGYVKDSYTQAVLDREIIFPTGLQTKSLGFAIPHTDAEHVEISTVAIATLEKPVNFRAMGSPDDEISVSIVMMLAVNDPKQVVNTLVKVISILENEVTIEKLVKATTSVEIFDAFNEHIRMVSN